MKNVSPTYYTQMRWFIQTTMVVFLISFIVFQPMEQEILDLHHDHFVSQNSQKEEGEPQETENHENDIEEDEDEVEKLISFHGIPAPKNAYLSGLTQKLPNHFSDFIKRIDSPPPQLV